MIEVIYDTVMHLGIQHKPQLTRLLTSHTSLSDFCFLCPIVWEEDIARCLICIAHIQKARIVLEVPVTMGRKLKFHCSYCDHSTSFAHGLFNSNLNLHIVHLHITYFIAFGSLVGNL